jgi:hypothetical protein
VLSWTRQQVTTLLTLIIVLLWTITAVVRLWVPWPVANVLDAAMPLIIGYWFVMNAGAKKNGAEA